MTIQWNEFGRYFHLRTPEMSYVFCVAQDGCLKHLYWGAALKTEASLQAMAQELLQTQTVLGGVNSIHCYEYEIPTMEPGDFAEPLLLGTQPDGVRSLRLAYVSHEIRGEELVVILRDRVYPFEVEAHYRGWGDMPLLSRWLVVRNLGEAPIVMDAMQSASWHVPPRDSYRLTHQSGNWGCEYTRNEVMLTQARTVLQNNRITATTAQQTPFFALDPGGKTTETMGEVYFGVLQWSGNFSITIERQFGQRYYVNGGVNSFDSQYPLQPGEAFETPKFTAGYVTGGFERMSEVFYDWQFDALLPRGDKICKPHLERPVIYNSWYPFLFDVNEENCLSLIDKCVDLGVELFVIDDGWMPGRVDAHAGLGDWVADEKRFPSGMSVIADRCHERGLKFGLWVEPEMVNPDSELYRAHPDWVIHDPTRPRTTHRHQLVLNLARDEIRDWAIAWLDDLIEKYHLDYLKWDMNRYVFENGWPDADPAQRRSLSIRYTRNLLAIWKHLNERHPDVLFENCAGGGGRSDFGLVPYADRINRSDNADPVDIMVIHEGFSMLFLPQTGGGAGNIAPARHHIHDRPTPLSFRIHWGMTGWMSIGINLLTSPQEELDQLRDAVAEYKRRRAELQDSYVYRIASAREKPYAIFQYVNRSRRAFTLFAFGHGMRCWDLAMPRMRMRGLIPEATYVCEDGRRMTGEALMNYGLLVQLKGDCDSRMERWAIE